MKEIFEQIVNFILEHFKSIHLIFLIVLIICFVFIVVWISHDFKKKNNFLQQLIDNKNSLMHLKIDLLNKSVYFFSNKELKNAKQISLKDFFDNYEEKDATALNRWFMNQLNKKILESNIKEILLNSKNRKYAIKDIFLCTLVNYKTTTIYVDWYHSVYYNYLKADYEIERLFFKLNKNSTVHIGIISFFNLKENLNKDVSINAIQLQQIIESIVRLSNNHHILTMLKDGDIGIIVLQEKNCLKYLEQLKQAINTYLDINDLNIYFNIAMYKNIGDKINYSDCLNKAKLLSNYLQENENHFSEIHYYNPEISYTSPEKNERLETIKNGIIKGKFSPSITTFFHAKDGKIAFYLYELNLKNKEFSNNEIKKCILLNSLQKQYIESYNKYLNESFKRFKKEQIIVDIMIKTPIWFVESFLENFEKPEDFHYYNFILCCSSLDFETNFNDDNLKSLKELKNQNIAICLEMNTLNLPRQEVLSLIDYVSFDENYINEHFNNSQSTLLLSNLFNDFKRLKVSIISCNLSDWNSLESHISNNAIIFSTKFLENDFKQNVGLNKKTLTKLKGIYNKYH